MAAAASAGLEGPAGRDGSAGVAEHGARDGGRCAGCTRPGTSAPWPRSRRRSCSATAPAAPSGRRTPSSRPSPIRSWQIWNEPNIPAFWASRPGPRGVRPHARRRRLARSTPPTRGPRSSPAGCRTPAPGSRSRAFVDAMYAAGARGAFDTLAIHPYAATPAGVLEILRLARAQLDRLGDPQRFHPRDRVRLGDRRAARDDHGLRGGPGRAAGEPPSTRCSRRAACCACAASSCSAGRTWHPNAGQADVWALHTGLLREDGTPKPALAAFRGRGARRGDRVAARAEPGGERDRCRRARAVGCTMTPATLAQVAGVSRRSLQIHRRLARGRLVVTVSVPPGGGTARVRIGYAAIRGGHVAARGSRRDHRARRRGARRLPAHAVRPASRRAARDRAPRQRPRHPTLSRHIPRRRASAADRSDTRGDMMSRLDRSTTAPADHAARRTRCSPARRDRRSSRSWPSRSAPAVDVTLYSPTVSGSIGGPGERRVRHREARACRPDRRHRPGGGGRRRRHRGRRPCRRTPCRTPATCSSSTTAARDARRTRATRLLYTVDEELFSGFPAAASRDRRRQRDHRLLRHLHGHDDPRARRLRRRHLGRCRRHELRASPRATPR